MVFFLLKALYAYSMSTRSIFSIIIEYILLCPDRPYHDPEWVFLKDFKRTSPFTNVNFFRSDEEFPAQCTVLFEKHSEFYLDPESLAMTGSALAKSLQRYALKD